jgi:hypothetical protein
VGDPHGRHCSRRTIDSRGRDRPPRHQTTPSDIAHRLSVPHRRALCFARMAHTRHCATAAACQGLDPPARIAWAGPTSASTPNPREEPSASTGADPRRLFELSFDGVRVIFSAVGNLRSRVRLLMVAVLVFVFAALVGYLLGPNRSTPLTEFRPRPQVVRIGSLGRSVSIPRLCASGCAQR